MGHFTLDLLKRQIEDYKPYGIRAYCELSTDVGGAGQALLPLFKCYVFDGRSEFIKSIS